MTLLLWEISLPNSLAMSHDVSYVQAASASSPPYPKIYTSLDYHLPVNMGDRIRVKPPYEVLTIGEKLWSNTIVGFFLGKHLLFFTVQCISS